MTGQGGATVVSKSEAKHPTLLARLRAWLGVEKAPLAPSASAGTRHAPEREREQAAAPLDRATVSQWLWGNGFIMPGNAEYVLELVKPFGLSPAMSMLDLSAGLGGPARAIAQAFGTYVTGLERSAERAKRGMELSIAANLSKRANIAQFDPETVELRPNGFDCVLARAATYNVIEKERLLRVVFQGLKQRGQLLLNEFTIDPGHPDSRELAAWSARETHPPQLWTIDQYTDCLTGLGFDIRVVEELTAQYKSMIVAGWSRMLEEVNLKGMERHHKLTIIDEAELWAHRLAALQSGALRVYRIYALANKPAR